LQETSVHAPLPQDTVALGKLHAVPQRPQFVRVFSWVSQPLLVDASLSQSP
jgi:hypothetical protein